MPHVWRTAWQQLQVVVPQTHGLLATIGLPLSLGNGVYNAICVAVDGQIAGFVCKRHLAGDGLHYEPRWFREWPAGQQARYSADGGDWPIGDLLFDCAGVLIGFEICEDAWVADRPAQDGEAWCGHNPESQCQSFCVWQASGAAAFCAGWIAGVWLRLCLCESVW